MGEMDRVLTSGELLGLIGDMQGAMGNIFGVIEQAEVGKVDMGDVAMLVSTEEVVNLARACNGAQAMDHPWLDSLVESCMRGFHPSVVAAVLYRQGLQGLAEVQDSFREFEIEIE